MNNSRIRPYRLRNLILIFQLLTLVLMIFYNGKNMTSQQIVVGFALIGLIFVSNILLRVISKGDGYIFPLASLLFSIGFVMIYRLDPALGERHVLWFAISLMAFYFIYFLMGFMKYFEDKAWIFLGICVVLFAMTIVFGKNIHGARNWIQIGSHSFQPSEITKISFIFLLASYYKNEKKYEQIQLKKIPIGKYILFMIVYFFIALFFLQKDLGSAVIFFGIYFVILFIYDSHRMLLLWNFLFITLGGVSGYYLFDHVKIRIATWINPWKYMDGIGYQITQSLFGIASGGFFGTGIGLGRPDFIPVAESDFIFAAICEELGIFAGIAVIMLFMILIYRGFKIALQQRVTFYNIVAIGISAMFAGQSLIMFGGVMKLIPLTGITIPFVSYGGSSLLSSFIALSVLQFASEEMKTETNPKTKRSSKEIFRIKMAISFFSVCFICLIIYLSYFQIFKAKKIADNPYNQRLTAYEKDITRGRFLDRNGELLAVNSIDDQGNTFRFYHYPRIYCHVLGYNHVQYGKYGLERSLNNTLLNIQDSTPINQIKSWIEQNNKGNDVELTIDTGLQTFAYNLLEGHKGAIVAMNPSNGKIYCMVSRPGFDPNTLESNWNELIEAENSPLLNRATQGLYTPGSVFKVITAAAVIETPTVSQEYNDTGEYTIEGYTIRNYGEKVYGEIGMKEALMYSVNTYFADLGIRMGREALNTMCEKFYFGDRIPFELPTSTSISGFSKESSKQEIAAASFGQGKTLVTPLNMALVTSTIANGGTMPAPILVNRVLSFEGNVLKETKPYALRRVLTPETAKHLTAYMTDTVAAGSLAAIQGVNVAGKSGTAEVGEDTTNAWFISFAPSDNPKVAVAVVLEEDGTHGADTAAPIAGEIMKYVLFQFNDR